MLHFVKLGCKFRFNSAVERLSITFYETVMIARDTNANVYDLS